jgi:AICAR transformylase/IMP cyclohydrolase PurH
MAIREGTADTPMRRRLAEKAFAHTRDYDTAIAAFFGEINQV